MVRTTATIDDEMLADAKAFAARQRRTLSDVVQDALRDSMMADRPQTHAVVELPTFGDPSERPLVDLSNKEALAEVLGDRGCARYPGLRTLDPLTP